MFSFIFRMAILAFLFVLQNTSFASTSQANKFVDVDDMLKNQNIIRIAADNTPGFGNQAASATIISRLRAFGYKGKVEFIYANLTTDKITTLFGLPKNIPDDYFDEVRNIEFIKLNMFVARHKDHTNPIVDFSMIGQSDDFGCSLARDDGIDVDHGMGPLDCVNEARFLDTKVNVDVSPYSLDSFSGFGNNFTLAKSLDPKGSYSQEGSLQTYFVNPPPSIEAVSKYLDTDPDGKKLVQDKPALEPFIAGLKNQSFNVLPVYGYTILSGTEPRYKNNFPGNILQILIAARYAQLNGTALYKKPLIIPVFYDYMNDANMLMTLIHSDQWGQYEQAGAATARDAIKNLNLARAFSVADIKDINTIQKIQNLRPGDILLLSVGPLPQIVFDGIYNTTGANIWPQIREGANTFNSLVLTGKPHFRCGESWEFGFANLQDLVLKNQLENFYSNFCRGMTTWASSPATPIQLGQFFIDAEDSHSSLLNYFIFLKNDASDLKKDRVYFALEGILKELNA